MPLIFVHYLHWRGNSQERLDHVRAMNQIKRKLIRLAALCFGVCGISIIGSRLLICASAEGRTFSDMSLIPYRRVGVVLGCSRHLSDGRQNLFFSYRVSAAAQLFKAGKIDYVIVSGDNHVAGYDEPTDMKQALVSAGIPSRKVYCDYAGFRTLDSVVRSRDVFDQTNITFVSQEFHNQRAIFIARHEGIDAVGFNAREVDSYNSFRTRLREQFARVKTVLDVYLLRARPKFGGPKISVGENGQP